MARKQHPDRSPEPGAAKSRSRRGARRRRSRLPEIESGELADLTEEDRERWLIYLVAISSAGGDHYRLDFVEGGIATSIVLEYLPTKGIVISRDFSRLYEGRATAWEAVRALGKFIRGETVDFPIAISEDGGDRPCS